MCTLTQRDLDFLASLTTRWQWLYWRELARILKEDVRADKPRLGDRTVTLRIVSR
ncbi:MULTISPECIES: hypothetical protein [unclassified Bradyrhizobium]|uniref:hypothetical protein n=1 Tax=unclassified Bradyrhizobium TaxID=2631580 RepID=UPI00247844BB|nr:MULTISPECIES: hypothetical protein [unclassified Bradyrhizobium]WGR69733.1 hypothetical protein MTX24_30675 [Bradyrhizobium sp. ISRA426]WGR81789.1 hypothetical protein MTX21_15785 [Bradyrhizobium sp. ISRA430]WGR84975.1 hypothetical protein MTX25_30350 [Bradyrhizobium sp. ISRA432]